MRRFENQFAVVVGAASGMGRACAAAFASEGACVTVIDRDRKGLDETALAIEAGGGRALAIVADITQEEQMVVAFDKALASFGRIDAAVNAAAIDQSFALTHEITMQDWQRILNVNVTGTWLCMREELRHMSVRGAGAIVNIASYGGLHSLARLSAYVASKHALVGLTKNAAVEYAGKGVRVNAIAPGGISTPMMERSFVGLEGERLAAARKALVDLHPIGRTGTVEEIADAVLYLCSKQSSFITGTCLSVDGGWAAN